MAVKRTLYQVLQVPRNAPPEAMAAAYEARLRALGEGTTPENQSERILLREAYDTLSDRVRRQMYDEKLRDEAARALSRGGEEIRARPSNAQGASAGSSPLGWMMGIGVLAAVAVGGAWIYLDHKHKAEALRIANERLAAEQKLREAEAEKRRQEQEWAQQQAERNRQVAEERRQEARMAAERQIDNARWQAEQQRNQMQQRQDEQRKAAALRQAEYDRQRADQENFRRAQMEAERDRRLLQEYERNSQRRY